MKTIRTLLLLACTLPFFAACGEKGSEVITPPKTETPAAPNPAVAAILAKADAQDGTTDKVVHNCAGCALHMPGNAEHSVALDGYTLHLCSPKCYDKFKADAAGEVLKLKVE